MKLLPAIADRPVPDAEHSPASVVAAGGGGYNLGIRTDSQREEHSWRQDQEMKRVLEH
jgi:hypothetical protein